MEKTELSKDVVRVKITGKNGIPVSMVLHSRDAGILQELTLDGDKERTWFCPKCKRAFATPL